jgi:hypothetical protein
VLLVDRRRSKAIDTYFLRDNGILIIIIIIFVDDINLAVVFAIAKYHQYDDNNDDRFRSTTTIKQELSFVIVYNYYKTEKNKNENKIVPAAIPTVE